MDVYAVKTDLFRTENLLVECKCHQDKIPVNEAEVFSTSVREIRGSLSGSVQGLFVSISELTASARVHLQKQGIDTIEGVSVRNFIGDPAYTELMRALLTTEDVEQYCGKVSFPTESISQILQVRGAEKLALEKVEGRYDPVAYCKAEISCKRDIQSVPRPILYKRRVAFAVAFGDHEPQIHDIVDGVSAEALSREAGNLADSALPGINTTSAPTVLSDPLVHSLLVTEACKRSRSVIHFSEVLEDWAEDGEELRARALERIREMEESETRETVAHDEDRISGLEEKIAETEADLEAHQTELAAIDGLEETARQTRR